MSLACGNTPSADWAFGYTLTGALVWNGVIQVCLIEDHLERGKTLVVPHTGEQKDRFIEAVRAHNARMRLFSQPEISHFCHKCTRFYTAPDGTFDHKVSVVVIDGVTISHPCCGVHACTQPLANNHHRFCLAHAVERNTICTIVGCDAPVVPTKLTCSDHAEIERVHREHGQAHFQLKERLQWARVAHPNDAVAEDVPLTDLADAEEVEEFSVDSTGPIIPEQLDNQGNKAHRAGVPQKNVRAQFGWKRTHNKQIIVAPCGMIFTRETFYGAEAISSIVVSNP